MRIKADVEEVLSYSSEVDPERAVIITQSYKENEGEHIYIRRAKFLRNVLERKTIYIKRNELIVGNLAFKPLASMIFPEFSYRWVIDEMENHPFEERDLEPYVIPEDTKEKLRGIADYWVGNTLCDRAEGLFPEALKKALDASVFSVGNYLTGGIGHYTMGYEKAIKHGLACVRDEARTRMSVLDPTDPDYADKKAFYSAVTMVVDGAEVYASRYAQMAEDMAEKESDAQRKRELLRIADNSRRVPMYPARDLWEACQAFWFVQVIVQIESNGHSISPGRLDQYMFPFYEKDTASGNLTKREAQEIIDSLWVKLGETEKIKCKEVTRAFSGACKSQNVQAGGITPEGKDATNDLSYIILNSTARTKMCEPAMSVRFSNKSPEELWEKAIEVIKVGLGMPALYNDEVIIPALLNRGVELEDARSYSIVGCVEPHVPGKTYGWHDSGFFNLAKCLELALNDGYPMDPSYDRNLGRVGLPTGTLLEMGTFDEVLKAYDKQVKYFVDLIILANNIIDRTHQEMAPVPFASILIDPCLEKGLDASRGGAKYNFTGPQGIAIANVADSLAALKKYVFTEGLSREDVYNALLRNWKGYEVVQSRLSQGPHFGNDDDYVDELAHHAALAYCKCVEKKPNARNGIFQPGLYPVSANVPFGESTWATPDGREAGIPLADGISPVHGQDVNGPTAVLKSVAKVDHVIASNGTLLNQKFHPSALEGIEGNRNFMNAMRVYFELGGLHNQVNVVSADVLRDAQKNPGKYANLVVRVAGYSAYFVRLGPVLQNDIIERTEFLAS
jgi:formate C-acetyltransferase